MEKFILDFFKDRTYEIVYTVSSNSAGSAVDYASGKSDHAYLGYNETLSITLGDGTKVECPKLHAIVYYVDNKLKNIPELNDMETISRLSEVFPKEIQYIRPDDIKKLYDRFEMAAERKYYDDMLKSCGALDFLLSPGLWTEWVKRKLK